MAADTAQPKQDSWPRTAHGTIDWEVVFERPETGLLSLMDQVNTPQGVLKISRVIIHALFSRDSDAENRVHYEKEINAIMVSSDPSRGFAIEPRKVLIVELLREIKENRVLNASFHVARQKADTDDQADNRLEERAETYEKYAADGRDAPEYVEDAFAMALTEMLAHRMQPLVHGAKPDTLDGTLLPFAVSDDFLERLLDMVYEHMSEEMEVPCRSIIRKAENEPPDRQVDFITENMETRQNRQVLWDAWKDAWTLLTEQSEPPPKPKEVKKGLFDKMKRQDAGPGVMTVEQWEVRVAQVQEANALAEEIWTELSAPSETFQPPKDKDKKLLMNLFARTPGAIRKQVTAIRQIAEQSGNRAKVFADYQSGKDIDLPLLAAICQRPDLFLGKGVLKDIMRSFPPAMRKSQFALVCRYFDDAG